MEKKDNQCGLIFENAKKEILLQLRDEKPTIKYPGCWGTFGGGVEEGENPKEAIKREVKEELNYNLKNPEFFGNFPFQGHNQFMFRKVDKNIKMGNFEVKEGQKGEFFSFENALKLKLASNDREIIIKYFKKFHREDVK